MAKPGHRNRRDKKMARKGITYLSAKKRRRIAARREKRAMRPHEFRSTMFPSITQV